MLRARRGMLALRVAPTQIIHLSACAGLHAAGRRFVLHGLQRRLVSSSPPSTPTPPFPGEPDKPSMKTAVPGPKSQALAKEMNEYQVRASDRGRCSALASRRTHAPLTSLRTTPNRAATTSVCVCCTVLLMAAHWFAVMPRAQLTRTATRCWTSSARSRRCRSATTTPR